MTAVALALWAAGVAAAEPEARRVALLVGVQAYDRADVPAGARWPALRGVANDVAAMEALLEARGFDVRVLRDQEATRAGIAEAFQTHLVEGVRPGQDDLALFYFAGHAQQVLDDAVDERDGYDEALVPFDHRGTRDPSGHIRDDEVAGWLGTLRERTDNAIFIVDACASGTTARSAAAGTTRGAPPAGTPTKGGTRRDGASGWLTAEEAGNAGYVALSAARADQDAREVPFDVLGGDPVVMGAFTFHLVRTIRQGAPGLTWRQLIDRVGAQLASRGLDQEPQAEGDVGKVVLSGTEGAGQRVHAAVMQSGGRIAVHAGQLHGIEVGDRLALFAAVSPGTALAPDNALFFAVVDESALTGSTAVPEGRVPPSVAAGGLVAILERPSVRLHGVARLDLRAATRAMARDLSGWAATADGPGTPELVLQTDAEGHWMLVSPHGPVPIPTSCDAGVTMRLAPDHPDLTALLGQAVDLHARRRRVLQLDNRDATTQLDASLDIRLVDATPAQAAQRPRLAPRQRFEVDVHNRSPVTVYASVIEVRSDGGLDVLVPGKGWGADHNQIPPDGHLRTPPRFEADTAPGAVAWRLIVTDRWVDVRALARRVTCGRSRGGGSALEQFLEATLAPSRGVVTVDRDAFRWGTDVVWGRIASDGP